MKKKKVVLAFSGGLDTTFCGVYLTKVLGMEVHALTVNTGGFSPAELERLESHASSLGLASFTVKDQLVPFYDEVIRYLVYGNILKNDTYPLSVSAERISQAQAVTDFAQQIGAEAIAHGSTGAGNDQVRFDMLIRILMPEAEIITPIRDLKLSREQEIAFLKEHHVMMNFEKAAYSINKGIWGTSVGGKETLTSDQPLPEEAFPDPVTKQLPEKFRLEFRTGDLIAVNGLAFPHPVEAIAFLATQLRGFGIGRDIHVGDTIIGIKGRVGFEAAAPMMIIKAHHALEKHVLTKWQLYWKDQLAAWYGNWLHEGQLLDPAMRDVEAFFRNTQQRVSGEVFLTAYPYRFTVDGIRSPFDLMSSRFGTYGEMNKSWTGEDVKGFSKIFGNQVEIYHKISEHAEQL
ncbi:MAG: argininosuccinate synthase [Bacteroidia bacterium]|nr:argininosuccinate synthase [Bacteroidia bacterium]